MWTHPARTGGEKASYYSAVCLETGEVEWMELERNSNAETSTAFLRQPRERHTGLLTVIWDNTSTHQADGGAESSTVAQPGTATDELPFSRGQTLPDGPAIKMGRHFSYKQTQMGSLQDDRNPQRSSPFESPRLDAASASGRLSQFPSVERRRTPCCGIRGVGFRSGRHRRLRPLLAAPCDERFTVRRSSKSGFVRHWLVRLHEMDRESHETQLPADAGCARPVLAPVFRKECCVREC